MSKMEVMRAADEMLGILRDLRGPKDAAMALLITHLRMTEGEELSLEQVNIMLKEYAAMFKTAYLEPIGKDAT